MNAKHLFYMFAMIFRLGVLHQKIQTLNFMSIQSAGFDDDNGSTMGKRMLLNQIGTKISGGMTARGNVLGDEANHLQVLARDFIEARCNEDEMYSFIEEVEAGSDIFRQFMSHIRQSL